VSAVLNFIELIDLSSVIRLMLIFMFFGLALKGVTMGLLRKRHPEIWLSLGKPVLFSNYSLAFERYVWFRGGYRDLDDPTLIRLVYVTRALTAIIVALFLFVMSVGIWRES
jgi:hypothetical protein